MHYGIVPFDDTTARIVIVPDIGGVECQVTITGVMAVKLLAALDIFPKSVLYTATFSNKSLHI